MLRFDCDEHMNKLVCSSGWKHWASCKNRSYTQICSQVLHTNDLGERAAFAIFFVFRIFFQVQTQFTSGPDLSTVFQIKFFFPRWIVHLIILKHF